MFRKMPLLLAGLCVASTALANKAAVHIEDAKTKLAIQLMEATHFDRSMQQMADQMPAMMAKQFESMIGSCEASSALVQEMSGKLGKLVTSTLNSEEMKVDVASVYAEVFSEDELRETIAFYQSPLGKKLLDRMPALMQKSLQISQDRMKALTPEMQKIGEEYGERIRTATAQCDAPKSSEMPKPREK